MLSLAAVCDVARAAPPSGPPPAWLGAAPLGAAPLDAAPLDAAPLDAAPLDAAPLDAAPLDGAVYAELKQIARRHLRVHSGGDTLSTTDLVHEAYLKLGSTGGPGWGSRSHFFGSASRAMRQVLVDYARQRQAAKRGGGVRPVTLTGSRAGRDAALEVRCDELLVLDEALDRLRTLDDRLGRVVELRFFAGLGDAEIAECLGVTVRTVGRDWVKARLFLARELARA